MRELPENGGRTEGAAVARQNANLRKLQNGETLRFKEVLSLTAALSFPAMMAELSTIIMEYVDASMVGSLGADATASIGLVASSTWLFGGIMASCTTGFTVQAAQMLGGRKEEQARNLMKQALIIGLLFSVVMAVIGCAVAKPLPGWLSDEEELFTDSMWYFLIHSAALPAFQMNSLAGGMLQSSGDMRTPALLNILTCTMNVVFNALFIFSSGTITVLGIPLPGLGLGVAGAALGTSLSMVITASLMLTALLARSPILKLRKGEPMHFVKDELKRALRIGLPVGVERVITSSAYVAFTSVVAPLGKVALAANSLSITAESLCYMPGYGVGAAASTLVGQSVGAGRKDLAKRMGWICTGFGVFFMTATGALMYAFAPQMLSMLTPDPQVRELGAAVLRIEAFAEPLYAASIVTAGALRGAGDTLAPSILSLISMWGVRIPAAAFLAPRYGLRGAWMAMAGELCFRGLIFLIRMARGRWMKKAGQ